MKNKSYCIHCRVPNNTTLAVCVARNILQRLERLDSEGLDDLAGWLGLEDARLLGEGVDAGASLGGGAGLHHETFHHKRKRNDMR